MQEIVTATFTRNKFIDARAKLDRISVEDIEFAATLSRSLEVVRQALDRFDPDSLAVSFNGGKDACVVLYLLLLVLAEKNQLELMCTSGGKGISVVYFQKEEFPEMDDFMKDITNGLGIQFLKYDMSYKDGMQDLVNSHGIKGVIMGQRKGDPGTEDMTHFTSSTPGWPQFMRINPAMDWKYHHVWRFLRGAGLQYCCLYDQGYTSLGERRNTARNEALRLATGGYLPAHALTQEHLERSPRRSMGGCVCIPPEDSRSGRSSDSSVDGGFQAKGTAFDSDTDWESSSAYGQIEEHLPEDLNGGDLSKESSLGVNDGRCHADDESNHPNCAGSAGRGDTKSSITALPTVKGDRNVVPIAEQEQAATMPWSDSARWLPATALVVVVLASVGMRRSGSFRGA